MESCFRVKNREEERKEREKKAKKKACEIPLLTNVLRNTRALMSHETMVLFVKFPDITMRNHMFQPKTVHKAKF